MGVVLVTGATGNVGSSAVHALRSRGVPVRALVRDSTKAVEKLGEGVELMIGDFSDLASVHRALAGVDRLFLSSADGPQKVIHETGVIDAACGQGVQLIVKASTIGAAPGSPLPAWDWNGRIEDHLRRSGVPAVTLQSQFYMTNLLAAAAQVRDHGTLVAPVGGGQIAMIDPMDVGAVAAAVLATGDPAGRTCTLTGSEAMTYAQVAAVLSEATGRQVQFVDVPDAAARQGLADAGLPSWLVEQPVGAFRMIREGRFKDTTETVRALTGCPPRSFSQWAWERASLF